MIAVLLGGSAVYVAAAAIVAWTLLVLARTHATAAWLGAAAALGLFLAHKLPGWPATHGAGQLNPILTSLRAVQQSSGLDKVQRLLGVRPTSLGSLSEATGVFAAEPLRQIVQELAARALPLEHGRDASARQ